MRVTIRQIAEKTHVSTSTVSRVLNNYAYVDEATRSAVLQVAQELGYPIANPRRVPRVQRTRMDPAEALAYANDLSVAGLVFIGGIVNHDLILELQKTTLPFVVVGAHVRPLQVNCVVADYLSGMQQVVAHLASTGRRRIGLVNGPTTTTSSAEKYKGFRLALALHHLEYDPARVIESEFDAESGYSQTLELLKRMPDADALAYAIDQTAIGGLRALKESGRRVSDDVAVTGFYGYNQYNAWNDRSQHIVGGIPDEIRQRMLARGFATYAGTLKEGDAVIGGIIQNKSGRQAILAQRVIDCTGDGDAAFHAGAAFEQGRPQDGRCQPTTLMFTIGGVDWPPVEAWRTSYQMRQVWLKAQADGIMQPFQDVIMGFWHTDVLPDQVGVNMTHMINVDSTNARHLTDATIEGRRQAHHLTEVFRQVVPGMEKCYLISTAPALGLRESRRIQGVVTITADDTVQPREWPDSIGYGSFFIDIHNPAGPGMGGQTWRPPAGFHYQIPYRALVPDKIDNLLVAGRCISADHVALGSLRIMVTCMVMGEAAGAAAVMSLHDEVTPRELDTARLGQQLRKQGAIVDESSIRQVDPPHVMNAIIKQQKEKAA